MWGKASVPHLPLATRNLPAMAVFARAPVAGHAKTRLTPLLGAEAAARFQAALISDTLSKVAGLRKCVRPYLFLAGNSPRTKTPSRVRQSLPYERARFEAHLSEFSLIRQRGKGLGERLEAAFGKLLRLHPICIVIGTDSPLLPSRVLRQALRELDVCESVLGPCPDGGYYLIGLRRPEGRRILQGIFDRVRWSTAFAFRDTLRNLLRRGLSCSVLEECADVDLPADLKRLREGLSRDRKARRLAPATWNFLRGSVVRRP
jgi:hypothetical protein